MIKFFRKIRQQLLKENRFTKYLLYAIGEIVLVVIGILIALSINNWNERRLLKIQEMKFLVGLDKSLFQHEVDLENNEDFTLKTLNSYTIINNHLSSNLPYHDSLSVHFGRCFDMTNFITNPLNLKTNGLDKISNEELKSIILKYYEFDIPHLVNIEKEWLNQHFNLRVVPFLIKNFNYVGLYSPASPKNYESLKNNFEFITLLNITQSIFKLKHELSTITFNSAKELRMQIHNELDKNEWDFIKADSIDIKRVDFTREFRNLNN